MHNDENMEIKKKASSKIGIRESWLNYYFAANFLLFSSSFFNRTHPLVSPLPLPHFSSLCIKKKASRILLHYALF
jgi:hypothetical protein